MTAVEFLLSELKKYGDTCPNYDINYIIDIPTHILTELEEQAKEMDKEKLKDAYDAGIWDVGCRAVNFDEYYNRTFKSK